MSRKDADKYFLSHNLEIYEMCLQKFVFWENSNEKESKEKLKRIFSKRIELSRSRSLCGFMV